jgi:class 3 adenylate cyclase
LKKAGRMNQIADWLKKLGLGQYAQQFAENDINFSVLPDLTERRQVTVMFCDLVGSTALAASMDPEDLREVISAYQKCAAETVRRFDGFVAKYMGDGVLIYFGYPQAHEDDAERAVRAGLELIAALAGLKTRTSLQTRIGIATGLVIVGDLIGSGEAQERGIVVKRRTWQPGCKELPSQTPSSLPKTHAGFLAISLS